MSPPPQAHTVAQETLHRGSWNLQYLVDTSLVIIIIYLVLNLSDPCSRVEKRENIYWFFWSRPSTRTLPQGGIKFKSTSTLPWSSVLNSQFDWSLLCCREEEFSLCNLYWHALPQECLPLGSSCFVTLRILHTQLGKVFRRRC